MSDSPPSMLCPWSYIKQKKQKRKLPFGNRRNETFIRVYSYFLIILLLHIMVSVIVVLLGSWSHFFFDIFSFSSFSREQQSNIHHLYFIGFGIDFVYLSISLSIYHSIYLSLILSALSLSLYFTDQIYLKKKKKNVGFFFQANIKNQSRNFISFKKFRN